MYKAPLAQLDARRASTKPSVPAVDFPRFGELPFELREEIWRLCLPYRVCEFDFTSDDSVYWGITEPWPCELSHTTSSNARPPALSRICRESRRVAFSAGGFLSNYDERPYEAQWSGCSIESWLDRKRDSLHMHWIPANDADYSYDAFGHPIRYLIWETANIPHGASIVMSYLEDCHYTRYGVPHSDDPKYAECYRVPDANIHQPVGPYKNQLGMGQLINFEALSQLPTLQVVMQVLVVHCEASKAAPTGLFGFLGDAPIQLVNPQDEVRLERYRTFAEQCEREQQDSVKQPLGAENAASMKQRLDEVIREQFDVPALSASMRPVIMFRLCTRKCNGYGRNYAERRSREEREARLLKQYGPRCSECMAQREGAPCPFVSSS